jgi:general secretion pathway protein M
MKQWWQELDVREKKLVAAMATVMTIFLLYNFIWQPLNENLAKSTKKLARQQALLTWVNNSTAHYQQVNIGGNKKSTGSISSIVNRTVRNYPITVTRMQPQGNELQVWIDEVAFKDLLKWLERLSLSEGLQVKGIDLTRGEKSGVVRVRRLQLGKS